MSSRDKCSLNAGDCPQCVSRGQRMLPNPNDPPSVTPQQPTLHAVARDVALDLASPEIRVVLRPRRVLRTPVPEAAVDEHREALLRKHEVGFDPQV